MQCMPTQQYEMAPQRLHLPVNPAAAHQPYPQQQEQQRQQQSSNVAPLTAARAMHGRPPGHLNTAGLAQPQNGAQQQLLAPSSAGAPASASGTTACGTEAAQQQLPLDPALVRSWATADVAYYENVLLDDYGSDAALVPPHELREEAVDGVFECFTVAR